jgi:hypothetical protein
MFYVGITQKALELLMSTHKFSADYQYGLADAIGFVGYGFRSFRCSIRL